MGKLLSLMENLKNLDPEKVAEQSLNEIAPDLVAAQKDQMTKGEDSASQEIRWQADSHYPYSKPYERKKRRLGGQTDKVDLKLKGDFYNRIEAKAENGKVIITSTDPKTKYLEKNYGRDLIYGLNPDHKSKVIQEKLKPVTFKNVREILSLK